MSADHVATTDSPHGGTLAWTEYGDPAGPPVFLFHGTPGSRLDHDPFDRPDGEGHMTLAMRHAPAFLDAFLA